MLSSNSPRIAESVRVHELSVLKKTHKEYRFIASIETPQFYPKHKLVPSNQTKESKNKIEDT